MINFKVGDRVALKSNPTELGTVSSPDWSGLWVLWDDKKRHSVIKWTDDNRFIKIIELPI